MRRVSVVRGLALALASLLLVGGVYLAPVAAAHEAPSAPAPPNPYLIFGNLWSPPHVSVPNEPIWVNDTTQGFSLATTSSGTGSYQVDLSQGTPAYQVGDVITVTARDSFYAAANSTTVFAPPTTQSWCNDTFGLVPVSTTLSVHPSLVFAGATVNATATASGGQPPYSYNWTFGDGTPKIFTDPLNFTHHLYNRPGAFALNVTANSTVPGNSTSTVTVDVLPLPTLTVTGTPATIQAGAGVLLVANLSMGGRGWSYDFTFGDGSTSGALPAGVNSTTHDYTAIGSYAVTATATNVSNALTVHGGPFVVSVTAGMGVTLSASPTLTEVGANTSFSALATNSDTPVTFDFAYGDGTTSGAQSADTSVHVYSAPSTGLTPSVTATNATAVTAHANGPTVVVEPHVAITLTPSVLSGFAPLAVDFTTAVTGGVGTLSYDFVLGNGVSYPTNLSGTAATVYDTAGTFTASVRVTDALGVHAGDSVTVTVSSLPPLTAQAEATPASGAAQLDVTFNGTAAGGSAPYAWHWDFGDGSAGSGAENPHHLYNTSGTFTAVLTVTDSETPSAHATGQVSVTVGAPAPLTATLGGQSHGPVDVSLPFNLTITGGIPTYNTLWLFGDGSGGLLIPTTLLAITEGHAFAHAGTYVVSVYVNDSESPQASYFVQFTVTIGAPTTAPSLVSQLLPGGSLFPFLLILLLLVIIGILVLFFLARRRREKEDEEVAAVAASVTASNAAVEGANEAAPTPAAAPPEAAAPPPAASPPPPEDDAVYFQEGSETPAAGETAPPSWDELGNESPPS